MLKDIIVDVKEEVKSDRNYKKGVSLVPKVVKLAYQDLLKEMSEEEALEYLESDLEVNVARGGSIYITIDFDKYRISDHSEHLSGRFKEQALIGSVSNSLRISKNGKEITE